MDDEKPARNRVLYQDGRAVMSRDANDKDATEDFSAFRLEALNNARASGAARPVFLDRVEEGGKAVKPSAVDAPAKPKGGQ